MMGPYVCLDCDLRADSSQTEREKNYVFKSITEKVKLQRLYFSPGGVISTEISPVFSPPPFPRFAAYFQICYLFASERSPPCFCVSLRVRACVCVYKPVS